MNFGPACFIELLLGRTSHFVLRFSTVFGRPFCPSSPSDLRCFDVQWTMIVCEVLVTWRFCFSERNTLARGGSLGGVRQFRRLAGLDGQPGHNPARASVPQP